jgi:hypothetical protein
MRRFQEKATLYDHHSQAEKNQIVSINWFAVLSGHEIELVFVLLRCNLRINFAVHAQNRFSRDPSRRQKSFPGHFEIALWTVWWHATLVSERDTIKPHGRSCPSAASRA